MKKKLILITILTVIILLIPLTVFAGRYDPCNGSQRWVQISVYRVPQMIQYLPSYWCTIIDNGVVDGNFCAMKNYTGRSVRLQGCANSNGFVNQWKWY